MKITKKKETIPTTLNCPIIYNLSCFFCTFAIGISSRRPYLIKKGERKVVSILLIQNQGRGHNQSRKITYPVRTILQFGRNTPTEHRICVRKRQHHYYRHETMIKCHYPLSKMKNNISKRGNEDQKRKEKKPQQTLRKL